MILIDDKIVFSRGTGNILFVCAFAAVLSNATNQAILSLQIGKYININDVNKNKNTQTFNRTIEVTESNAKDIFCNANEYKNVNLKLNAYYQYHTFYSEHRDYVKDILKPRFKIENKKNTKDIVLHIRLDDFNFAGHNSQIVDFSWYDKILQSETYENVYIVYDANPHTRTKYAINKKNYKQAENLYIKQFEKYNPKYHSKSLCEDLCFISSFDKILCSNSTFCWWAAFLSSASKIYFPNKINELFGFSESNIYVPSTNINILTLL